MNYTYTLNAIQNLLLWIGIILLIGFSTIVILLRHIYDLLKNLVVTGKAATPPAEERE